MAALDDTCSPFSVQPGYPRVNLWPDSAAALCGSADALPAITPTWGKGYLALRGEARPAVSRQSGDAKAAFHPAPAPLAAVYMIGSRHPGPEPEIVEQSAIDAFMALAANTYTPYSYSRPPQVVTERQYMPSAAVSFGLGWGKGGRARR